MDNNVLVPKPHRILSMLKHTSTECTFRVACDNEPDYGQFFMLSLGKFCMNIDRTYCLSMEWFECTSLEEICHIDDS